MHALRAAAQASRRAALALPPPVPPIQACGAQAHMVCSAVTGAAREPVYEFWLHGTEGTLHLDVDNGQLSLALKSGAGRGPWEGRRAPRPRLPVAGSRPQPACLLGMQRRARALGRTAAPPVAVATRGSSPASPAAPFPQRAGSSSRWRCHTRCAASGGWSRSLSTPSGEPGPALSTPVCGTGSTAGRAACAARLGWPCPGSLVPARREP